MSKPLSASDLLEEIDNFISEKIEEISDSIMFDLIEHSGHESCHGLEHFLRLANGLSVLSILRIDIRHKYKHAELQSWGEDEVV